MSKVLMFMLIAAVVVVSIESFPDAIPINPILPCLGYGANCGANVKNAACCGGYVCSAQTFKCSASVGPVTSQPQRQRPAIQPGQRPGQQPGQRPGQRPGQGGR